MGEIFLAVKELSSVSQYSVNKVAQLELVFLVHKCLHVHITNPTEKWGPEIVLSVPIVPGAFKNNMFLILNTALCVIAEYAGPVTPFHRVIMAAQGS